MRGIAEILIGLFSEEVVTDLLALKVISLSFPVPWALPISSVIRVFVNTPDVDI